MSRWPGAGADSTPVLLVAFDGPMAVRLSRRLEAHAVTVCRAAGAQEARHRLAGVGPAVVCVGSGLAAAAAARLVRAATDEPQPRLCLALAGGPDLSPFQDLVDEDRLFYVSRRPPAEEEIETLVTAAAGRLRRAGREGAGEALPEERRIDARRTVLELTRQLAAADDPARAAQRVARAARSLVEAHRARCVLHDPRTQTFRAAEDGEERDGGGQSAAAGLVGYAIRTGRAVRVERLGDDPRWDPDGDSADGGADQRFLALPLVAETADATTHKAAAGALDGGVAASEERLWAVLVLTRAATAEPFSDADLQVLEFLARAVAPLAGRLRMRRQLDELLAAHGGGDAAGSERLFRRRAVEHHSGGARRGTGRPLQVSPSWMRWTFAVLIAASCAALLFMALARVDRYASGTAVVRADGRTDVTARLAGTVASIAVRPGQAVAADQLLLRLDGAEERAELARIEREIELALAQRLRDPAERSTETRLQTLRASRDLAAARLTARSLRAPHTGVVGDVRVRPGQPVTPGQILLSLVGERSDLWLVVMFPGHVRPQLAAGMPLRLELEGYRHAYQELEIDRVAREAVGPAEARRILGAEIGDAVPVSAPVVFAWARLPAAGTFRSGGRSYPYHEGLSGVAEVRVSSQRVLAALVPGLDGRGGER